MLRRRVLRRPARTVRILVAAALTTAVTTAAASATTAPGVPGRSATNPIVNIGPPASPPPVYVDIQWPDGSRETVPATEAGPPSAALAEATMLVRARAEGRTPNGVRTLTDTIGATACSWSIQTPYKADFETAAGNATVQCTPDVWAISGSLYLYRSGSLIGQDNEGGGTMAKPQSTMFWYVQGRCAAGTYLYFEQLNYGIMSLFNGSGYWSHPSSPAYINC